MTDQNMKTLMAAARKALAWAGSPSPEWGGATIEQTDPEIRKWSTPMRRALKRLEATPI